LLSSMSAEGMGPSMVVVEGSTTKAVFETYAERVLAPALTPGQVVAMDNLSPHKGPRVREVRELVEGRGCELLYLPPYSSPDLNPIGEAFAKLKALLRKAGARTREALIEAMGRALETVTASDARGFFEHRGYCPLAQPL
jgi:transposase